MYQPKLTRKQFDFVKEALQYTRECYNNCELDEAIEIALTCLERHTEGYEGKILGLSRDEFLLKMREHIDNMTDKEWQESIERAKAAALADAEYFGEAYEMDC